jgi:23S rRNA (adenine2503-C2)-methyltransferase
VNLCGLSADEIFDLIVPYGYSYSHAVKISNFIYKKRIDIYQCRNIPGDLRSILKSVSKTGIISYISSEESDDKSVKYLFQTETGKRFESVYLPDGKRHTVCVSTQSGCRMGCKFCLSGRYGFHGNLSSGEILSQILSLPYAEKITHVVFMGMGEPMDNLDNVLKACNIITAEWGLALSPRNITVSTVGIKPGIKKFLEKSACNLTLSLHSPFHEERQNVVPMESKYPAGDLISMMKDYRLKKGRRLSVAYVMIEGLNDSDKHLERLISMLAGTSIRVNLLPFHSVNDDSLRPSSYSRMQFFKHNLVISGISASVRKSRGKDISAACGLLAAGFGKSSSV